MNGILLVNKEKNFTSRDIVNNISKNLKIKKVGHAGTLDPLATGLMVIGIGKATKILDLLTLDKKEYIATVKMGISTDTLDITGNIVNKQDDFTITELKLRETLNTFLGTYNQIVPKYSAVKINGKRLYDYARNNIEIELPKRLVNIYSIELINIDFSKNEFTFKTLVSKGTYIRSLINDIGIKLNILCTMKDLIRTKCGKFDLCMSNKLNNINYNNIISIKDALDIKVVKIEDNVLYNRVKNGNYVVMENEKNEMILFIDQDENEMAIYKKKNNFEFIVYKVFSN